MKNLLYIAFALIGMCIYSCSNCEDFEVVSCSEDPIPNSEYCNWTVATCYAREAQPVAVMYDTRFNSTVTPGTDWGTSVTTIHPSNWTASGIGQVFGITMDNQDNVYLASSDIFNYREAGWAGSIKPSSNLSRPAAFTCGTIFKCSPPSYLATPWATIPNTCDAVNGIGNITYDKFNNQFFASNLEDGKIYPIDATGTPGTPYDPWLPDSGLAGLDPTFDDLVFGLAVNNEGGVIKLYFPKVSGGMASIYSLALVNGDFPAAGSEKLEFTFPVTQKFITDLAISDDNQKMLLSERGDPHNSRCWSYELIGGIWTLNKEYFIGANGGARNNSAGGVDFAYVDDNDSASAECNSFFFSSGNYMDARSVSGKIYGLQGISYAGNNSSTDLAPTANQDTDLFIDLDGIYNTTPKGGIGDVEVFDCTECFDPCLLKDFTP